MINGINKVYLGDSSITKAYLGTDIVFNSDNKVLKWELVSSKSGAVGNFCYGYNRLIYTRNSYMQYSYNYGKDEYQGESISGKSVSDIKYREGFWRVGKDGVYYSQEGEANWSLWVNASLYKIATSGNTSNDSLLIIPSSLKNNYAYFSMNDTQTPIKLNKIIDSRDNTSNPLVTYGYVDGDESSRGYKYVVTYLCNATYPWVIKTNDLSNGDSTNWATYSSSGILGNNEFPNSLEFFKGYFILGTNKSNVFISKNLKNWTKVINGADYEYYSSYVKIVPGNRYCIAVLGDSMIFTSADGVNWIKDNSPTPTSISSSSSVQMIYTGDRFIFTPNIYNNKIYQAIC